MASPGSTPAANILEPELFAIKIPRLVILSILTLGLYDTYWFYRNWSALRASDESIKHPVWRAIFSIFYCYPLFETVLNKAKGLGYRARFSPGVLASIYIIWLLLGNVWGRADNLDRTLDILLFVIVSMSVLPLVAVQRAILFINEKEGRNFTFKPKPGELILIIIGIIVFGLSAIDVLQ